MNTLYYEVVLTMPKCVISKNLYRLMSINAKYDV